MMARLPPFNAAILTAISKVLGDTAQGLKGEEIGHMLALRRIPDPDPGITKWKRLFNAFVAAQNQHGVGNHAIQFINEAMAPARYVADRDLFISRRDGLTVALAFAGFAVSDDGKVVRTTVETTLDGALARATRLQTVLESRGTHVEVLRYCRPELLQENYFHAVLEAVKGMAERLRTLSGLSTDGADLVNQALSTKAPLIAINALQTETEFSEQKGIATLLVGVFSAIRNPTAHAPKVSWALPEQDAVDILGLLSFIHRKLDTAVRR